MKLFSFENFAKRHDTFITVAKLRWWRHKKEPGFQECTINIGNRLYIDETKFFEFIEEKQKTGWSVLERDKKNRRIK